MVIFLLFVYYSVVISYFGYFYFVTGPLMLDTVNYVVLSSVLWSMYGRMPYIGVIVESRRMNLMNKLLEISHLGDPSAISVIFFRVFSLIIHYNL